MSDNREAALVKARGLGKRYDGRWVLQGVDLDIFPREIVTLIGPNGSGKTTLLKVLLGLSPADAGAIRKKDGLTVGYVPQRQQFDPNLPITVQSYLKLFAADRTAIAAVMVEVDILKLEHSPMAGLSGGEMQRVLLAQALLNDPDLLVLDEPVQGVDLMGQAKLYEQVRNLSRMRQCAVLLVSHDLHVVMAGTDRVMCLNQHICCSGSPQSVSKDPAFVQMFGPDIASQVALYVHEHDHRHTVGGEVVHHGH